MEHAIRLFAPLQAGRAVVARAADLLRRTLMVTLQAVLGAFVVGYPMLRLGYLGPVPEGRAIEAALAIIAGTLALALVLLEDGNYRVPSSG